MKKRISIFCVLYFSLILLAAWNEDVWSHSLSKLSSIVSLIEDNYYLEVDREELAYSSIKGMLRSLDPHSNLLENKNLSRMTEEYKGKYFGLGIMIQKQEDRLVVVSPIEGGPAYRLGIQAGDVISHINGESTKPITSYEAMQKLRGRKGTKVNITIVREGLNQPFDLTVIREEIPLHSVPYAFILRDDIGYIFIRNFATTTTKEFREKMNFLTDKGMKKLILDLRGNGGGAFAQSIEISDEFLPKGALIVSIKGRRSYYNREIRAVGNNQYEDLPLVILINQGSASASEIVSGAIKDHDRGIIVGEGSWGKGLVQTVFPLAPNAAISLSTAKYYTPSGRSIQKDYTQIEDYLLQRDVPEQEREVRYTANGRRVLGQGGITPDYDVNFSYKDVTVRLLFKGAFFSYVQIFKNRGTDLSQEYIFPDDIDSQTGNTGKGKTINKCFKVDSQVIDDFKSFLQARKIAFDKDGFEDARSEIVRELEREFFSSFWGIEEGWRVFRNSDPYVLKAIEILPEAGALIHKK